MPHEQESPSPVATEIIRLHRFFDAWFTGTGENSDRYFSEHFASCMAPDLHLVFPSGRDVTAETFLSEMRTAHGSNPQFKAQVRNVREKELGDRSRIVFATYEEWQKGALNSKPPNNGRVSSAAFLEDRSRPGGLMWLHVHETWLPEAVISADPFSF